VDASVPADTCLIVSAEGFRPGEAVTARLLSSADRTAQLRADRTGTVHYRFHALNAKRTPKISDVLTLVESAAVRPAKDPVAVSRNVAVTVPRFAIYRFSVRA
jgi:hypothetical protein